MLYAALRALLFRLDAEQAHDFTLKALKFTARGPIATHLKGRVADSPVRVMGLDFPNPVGLSAGLDKNGDCIEGLSALGFGFTEIGTVTPRPQPGNPKPRMFRLPEHEALINRFGFNNKGVDYLIGQVEKAQRPAVLGINIGKNFDTDVERANDDYLICLEKVYAHADYVTVNVSSPNTPGLRQLQHGKMLDDLFETLKQAQNRLSDQHGRYTPVVIKIAPDLDDTEIEEIAKSVERFGIDGVIATNTTFSRSGVESSPHAKEQGGLSGAPLTERSTEVVAKLCKALDGAAPVIGVGGIHRPEDAVAKFQAGASLVQLYTGFVYGGPRLIADIVSSHQAMKGN